ncbi:hypothetical protein HKX54_15440 [Sulfitobacter sp. M57]|uniref:hypothetical protein n=1 Tax=unclassified Sulfitobacter TaxID=196795 RepID=UPI0023E0B598|nr:MULTISPECIES: hypothetical protein [unclassified Sulfitobacter]MDF3415861.1 hypothetical protein [Sulfitobacter sp. KE5]MDF3423341.1 hypothetical protein [Sulfitobacter sp. KE43]MDF3434407.1 hypothetical protein [Sulfitobacter sp. KE42]MDF3460047.1 hypothetical protein [Sulfitobacter sp. S74]MDF3463945.1 hypothetical protein [Sulfitobacter sp. Ks18]
MRWKFLLTLIFVAVVSFIIGQKYQRFIYDDICLDMGGGQHPGDLPICVLERPDDV